MEWVFFSVVLNPLWIAPAANAPAHVLSETGSPWCIAAEPPLLLGDSWWGRGAEGWESGDPSSAQISWASINSMSMQWATMSSWRQKSPWELEEDSGELQVRNSSTCLPLPCTQSCLGPVKLVAFYTLHRLNKGARRRNEMFLSFVHVIVRASDLCQRNQVQRGHHSALVGLSQKQRPQQLQTVGFSYRKGTQGGLKKRIRKQKWYAAVYSFSWNPLTHFGRRGEAREIGAEMEMSHSVENSDLISKNMKDCSQNRSCNAS